MILRWVAVPLLVAVGCAPVVAGGTLVWTGTPEDLSRGRADGMAVSRRGKVSLAPRLDRIARSEGQASHVWAMSAAGDGSVFYGTGPDGTIFKIDSRGKTRPFFSVAEPMVTALAMLPSGDLIAGTSPSGRIYRIAPDGSGSVWAETDERYVWSFAVTAAGHVFAGTGERGRVIRIEDNGRVDVLFDSDDAHIVSLQPAGDDLLAGGAGRGLVYRLDREGHALVLHDDDLPEVVDLVEEPGGAVVAAILAAPEVASRRPAVNIRLPDGVQVGPTDENVGSLEESTGPTLRGVIEGLEPDRGRGEDRVLGRIVRIHPDGRTEELWSAASEAPFCVMVDEAGGILFGTGEPARLYRIDDSGDVALLASLDEAQVTAMTRSNGSVVLGTSNPVTSYRVGREPAEEGTYVSRPFDAGGMTRWGSIRWKQSDESGRTELYTRTGSSADPDETWSAWSPALTDPTGSPVINPDGRFLQWRVRQMVRGTVPGEVSDVAVAYEPHNRPPRLIAVEIGPAAPGQPLAVDWTARDPDRDRLETTLQYRASGSDPWLDATYGASESEPDPTGRQAGRLAWPTESLAEGVYDVRVVTSDQPGNAPGEGLVRPSEGVMTHRVDRTPPAMEVRRVDAATVEVVLRDAYSDVRRLEILEDDRVRFTPRPVDGVCDSGDEVFRFAAPADSRWTVRGADAAQNTVERPIEGP